jgi:homoserine dehydrogenase
MNILIAGTGAMAFGFQSLAWRRHPDWKFFFHGSKDSATSFLDRLYRCDALVVAISTHDDGSVACDMILKAVQLGKPVVTCEKGALSEYFADLVDYLKLIGYNAACGGGTNILCLLRNTLGVKRIFGIVNATCNYVSWFTRQAEGPFETRLQKGIKEAQRLLLCEPGADSLARIINSELADACRKTVIVYNSANHEKPIRFSDMSMMTFSDSGALELFREKEKALMISIVPRETNDALVIQKSCFWTKTDSHLITGRFIETEGFFPFVPERQGNCLLVEDYGGTAFVCGNKGAGIVPTSAAMLGDLELLLNTRG